VRGKRPREGPEAAIGRGRRPRRALCQRYVITGALDGDIRRVAEKISRQMKARGVLLPLYLSVPRLALSLGVAKPAQSLASCFYWGF